MECDYFRGIKVPEKIIEKRLIQVGFNPKWNRCGVHHQAVTGEAHNLEVCFFKPKSHNMTSQEACIMVHMKTQCTRKTDQKIEEL